jgi:hypothetical protein
MENFHPLIIVIVTKIIIEGEMAKEIIYSFSMEHSILTKLGLQGGFGCHGSFSFE